MFFKFASIASNQLEESKQYAFAFDSGKWDQAVVNSKFRVFATYGDRLIQHSGDWPVSVELFADYLLSLVAYLLELQGTDSEFFEQVLRGVGYLFTDRPSSQLIAFAAGVEWNAEKDKWPNDRYYWVKGQKTSRSQAKEHDKRYVRVQEWNDGSPEAILP
jgi:hypothetical protein